MPNYPDPTSVPLQRLAPFAARINFAFATLAGILTAFGALLMLAPQDDPIGEGYMWGFLLVIVTAPFALAFGLAGLAWMRGWPGRSLVQTGPVLVAVGWWFLTRPPG